MGRLLLTRRAEINPFVTRDGSVIRELMHPASHGCERQSLAEAVLRTGGKTLLHRHFLSEEIYHILAGCGQMRLGDECHHVTAGDTVCIPPGLPHNIETTGEQELVFICCCTPPYSHDDTELLDSAMESGA